MNFNEALFEKKTLLQSVFFMYNERGVSVCLILLGTSQPRAP